MVHLYHISFFLVVEDYIPDRNAVVLGVEDEDLKIEEIVWSSDMPSYALTSASALCLLNQ